MSARNALCLMMASAALAAAAEPPRDEVESANHLLRQGKSADALQAYRNLQIDDPESELLYYNIGCAQLESADTPGVADDPTAAVEALTEARASFDKAAMAQKPEIRRDARFNRVNCDSRLAKQLAAAGDHQAAVEAFENAIYGYEDFLDQYPDHEGAQKNLGHMRYLLKKMLQNPPPEQEQQQQNESGEGESEDEQEQQDQQEQQQPGEGQTGDDEGDSSEQDPSEQEQEEQSGDEDGNQNESGEDQQQQSEDQQSGGEGAGGEQQDSGENQAESNAPMDEQPSELPNKETIEAILDALKERDDAEQHNMRRAPQERRRSSQWW